MQLTRQKMVSVIHNYLVWSFFVVAYIYTVYFTILLYTVLRFSKV